LFEHDLFGKPVSTFPDHALVDRIGAACWSVVSEKNGRPAMKIYGDSNSGNCLKVKFVCEHLAIPYTWIEIDTRKRQTRTTEFLKLNGAGQVPTVEFDDGRTLAESNAIIKCLARGSDLIPADAFAAAKMDEWLFWEQYSHEPYIAVCRFQMVYLGKPASDLDPDKIKRGYAALARMEHQLAATPFLVGTAVSLADVSLLAYTRVAHEGGFHLEGYASLRRWIGETEKALGLQPVP
jgi:glutathione S-transferase